VRAVGLQHRNAPARQRQSCAVWAYDGRALHWRLIDRSGSYPRVGRLPPEGGDGREPPVVVCENDARPLPPQQHKRRCRTVVTVGLLSDHTIAAWCGARCAAYCTLYSCTFAGARCTFYALILSNPLCSIVHIACCISYLLFYRIPCVLCVALSHACINSPGVR
jgi:hypothetical protein